MKLPFTVTDGSAAVFIGGRMQSLSATDPKFSSLIAELKKENHDKDAIESLLDTPKHLNKITHGAVTVADDVVYYGGKEIRNSLANKLIALAGDGFSVKPWALFMEKLYSNPIESARESLFDFLDRFNAPLTEDGCFLAFKRVRSDFMDIHSGTFDNSPGNMLEIPREEVDANRHVQCSYGLHACATSYLSQFYSNMADSKVVVVKIDPADVIAVPADYNFAKMRVCKYLVLSEAQESTYKEFEETVLKKTKKAAAAPVKTERYIPIADEAETFATYWKPVVSGWNGASVSVGSFVRRSLVATNPDLPTNMFLVGAITAIFADCVFVEWQDGGMAQYHFTELLKVEKRNADDIYNYTVVDEYDEDSYEEYDDYGYNVDGYDRDGYNTDGYDRFGFSRDGYDYDGYDESGFDENGYDKDGYDENGYDENGCDIFGNGPDDYDTENDVVDESAAAEENTTPSQVSFTRDGKTYTGDQLLAGISVNGQRGFAKIIGVPRSTLQDWVSKL